MGPYLRRHALAFASAAAFVLAGCGKEDRDRTPPTFGSIAASPDPAKIGDTLTITFTASEALSANPTVTVDGNAAAFVSESALSYTYSYVVAGTETEGAAAIAVAGDDLTGNPGSESGSVVLDFTADVAGHWKVSADMGAGAMYGFMCLEQAGASVSGLQSELVITGSVSGNTLTFTGDLGDAGSYASTTATVTGPDEFSGSFEFYQGGALVGSGTENGVRYEPSGQFAASGTFDGQAVSADTLSNGSGLIVGESGVATGLEVHHVAADLCIRMLFGNPEKIDVGAFTVTPDPTAADEIGVDFFVTTQAGGGYHGADSGSVTITKFDATGITGTFSFDFAGGAETVAGSFDVPWDIMVGGIAVTVPNGGETWYYLGTDRLVTWTSLWALGNVDIHYSADGGTTWKPVALDIADTGSYTWTIPNEDSAQCLVRVQETGGGGLSDVSNAPFTIAPATIAVTSPNGGEMWYYQGEDQGIAWASAGVTGNVDIHYSADGGTNWAAVALNIGNTGSHTWTIPNETSAQCLVRVQEAGGTGASDVSDAPFRIAPATITVTSPNGNEKWGIGSTCTIRWNQVGVQNVRIELSRDGGLTWPTLIAASVDAAAGSYPWTVEGPEDADCRVRISDAAGGALSDISNADFEIAAPFLTVVSPNGNEKWGIGTTRTIRWNQLGVQNVRIELSRDGGATWPELIAASVDAAAGSYPWTVTNPEATQCTVRISDADGGPLSDTSDGLFEIAMPSLTLLALTGDGPPWEIQDTMVISWTAVGFDEVLIEIYREKDTVIVPWELLEPGASSVPAQGSYTWTVEPGTLGVPQDCRIRVLNAANPTFPPPDQSAVFTIMWDGIYRAAPTGDNSDGTTWATAYTHPQTAMDWAGSGDEIWVAAGTYVENDADGVVLAMDPSTAVYGGFAGTEYAWALRNPQTRVTKLDGENSAEHVVTGASGARLDGFTITRGAANTSGGGMYNDSDTGVEVANCTFESNTAGSGSTDYGGGMYNYYSTVTVTNCEFVSNSAYQGGGAACLGGTVTFSKCVFKGNDAGATSGYQGGGGLYSVSEGAVSNCVFWNNSAYYGGGMYTDVWSVGTLLIVNCTVAGNSATYGGGMFDYWSESFLPIVNTIVWGNSAPSGPGIYAWGTLAVDYSCVQGGFAGGTGNIFQDPMFIGESSGNFRLRASSPCRDAGTSAGAPADDIDGKLRGAAVDMGAYEY